MLPTRNSGSEICNFIKKEIPTQLFPFEFCKIFKNTFFTNHLWVIAFDPWDVVQHERLGKSMPTKFPLTETRYKCYNCEIPQTV